MAMLGGKREEPAPMIPPPTPAPTGRMGPPDAHTVLGRESSFSGKLTFEGAVRIDGKFEGEIQTKDLLLVGPSAEVKAKLDVGSIVINGSVEGDITAKGSVEIKAPGRLKGNVTTPSLIIEKGVTFDGTCSMTGAASEPSRGGSSAGTPPPPPLPNRG